MAILQIGAGCPRQATVDRAISTACYALFHAGAGECVARTVGPPRSRHDWEVVTPIYRPIDHGTARTVFERQARHRATKVEARLLAGRSLDLQSARDAADHDPASRSSRQEARDFIDGAPWTIETLRSLPKEDRLILVAQLITKPR